MSHSSGEDSYNKAEGVHRTESKVKEEFLEVLNLWE
jgi:hypothetical protein